MMLGDSLHHHACPFLIVSGLKRYDVKPLIYTPKSSLQSKEKIGTVFQHTS